MSYDILLESDLDLPESSQHVTGVEIVAQRVHLRLITSEGEWILDRFQGLPYIDWVTNKLSTRRAQIIAQRIRAEILTTPGVVALEDYTTEFERSSSTFKLSGTVYVDEGLAFTFTTSPGATAVTDPNGSPFFLYQLTQRGPIAPL